MPLIATNSSKELMLEIIVNKTISGGDRKLKLFVNNVVPTINTVVGDLTECNSAGYSEKTLEGDQWEVGTLGGLTSASYLEQTFDIDEEVLIYGYYVTNQSGDKILWVERFEGAPFSLPTGGGSIGIELNFNLN